MRALMWRVALPLLLLIGCGDSAASSNGDGGADSGGPPALSPECGDMSVCTVDYPCEMLDPSYRCRGQFADWAPADSPTTFTNNGDGTVTDSRNGLVWQQGVDEGSFTWTEAIAYCGSIELPGTGWRLPAKAELESIVDLSKATPSIDQTIFPDTPADFYWTSSPYMGAADNAWFVYFEKGYSYYHTTEILYRVRCVR